MSVQKVQLHTPPLEEVASVLQEGLQKNYAEVSVSVVNCPDLTQPPFLLVKEGLGGSPRLADVGGVPYLVPLPKLDKVYDFEKVAEQSEVSGAFIIGAGAGDAHHEGVNAEMMANVYIGSGDSGIIDGSRICKVNPEDGGYILKKMGSTKFCLVGNFLISEGKPGKFGEQLCIEPTHEPSVDLCTEPPCHPQLPTLPPPLDSDQPPMKVLEVKARKRTGDKSIMVALRETLKEHYGSQPVGLGGTFCVETGKVKIHVMPAFSECPLESDEDLKKWLKFYDMSAPFVCVGQLISHDPDLDLRIEHFHGYSEHGDGGHYHCDITPDEVSYRGYFNIGEYMIRIDRPSVTHMVGRV